MGVLLEAHSYGKSRVRLTKVERRADQHDLLEWAIDVRLTGDFAAAYTAGDNRRVIATDTMKNVVYALAADRPLSAPEEFALTLGRHFLTYPQVVSAALTVRCEPWERVVMAGRPHPHTFVGGGGGVRTCRVESTRSGEQVAAGIDGLLVLKTTDSAWKDFHRDQYRTLPDAEDRILATSLTAEWVYANPTDWDAAFAAARQALVETFAGHKSLGAQHTLHALGEAVLGAIPEAGQVSIAMPNRHRVPVDLKPFGRENPNAVFVATDEPHGVIHGTLRRV